MHLRRPAILDPLILNLAVALGIGLLIGAERERRKGEGPSRAPAGIRTFTVTSMAGAVSVLVGGELLLAVAAAGVIVLATAGYWRSQEADPGLTTEIALIVTVLLGGLATQRPELAGGLAVVLALLLASRSLLHRFVRSVLTAEELEDILIFAGASLVILPLVPDRPMGPYGALNPHAIWLLVLLIMAISAAGYLAVRVFGARLGLPLAGLASGFVSSAATIGAMGARAARTPQLMPAAVAGAALSTVATVLQMAMVLAATNLATLRVLALPLICAGAAAVIYGSACTVLAIRHKAEPEAQRGRAFSLGTALLLALTLSGILLASAALQDWFGQAGILVAVALAGFADTHSAAISVAALAASEKISAADTVIPILAALSTNTISKMVFAASSGGWRFALRIIPGLVLVALAAWAGTLDILAGIGG